MWFTLWWFEFVVGLLLWVLLNWFCGSLLLATGFDFWLLVNAGSMRCLAFGADRFACCGFVAVVGFDCVVCLVVGW